VLIKFLKSQKKFKAFEYRLLDDTCIPEKVLELSAAVLDRNMGVS